MTREQIELLDGIIISEEQVELIELNPEVTDDVWRNDKFVFEITK